jgi:aromatic ring-opening dioxygenase catalytic subunit (LigB family)
MYANESLPSVFISHGAPDILLSESPAMDAMQNLAGRFPDPRAIVVVSAHWTDNPVGVTTGVQLSTNNQRGQQSKGSVSIDLADIAIKGVSFD